jgi:hypothetical protein
MMLVNIMVSIDTVGELVSSLPRYKFCVVADGSFGDLAVVEI